MISSISNSNIAQTISATNLSSKTAEEANKSTSEKITESNGQNSKTDTVEISAEAMAALNASTSTSATSASIANTTATSATATSAAVANTAATSATATSTTATSTAATPSLTGMTEVAMNKLVTAGTITQSQENEEVAKRAAAQNSSSETSTQQSVQSSNQNSAQEIDMYA